MDVKAREEIEALLERGERERCVELLEIDRAGRREIEALHEAA